MNDVRDFSLILDSRVPLIVTETYEERRAQEMITRVVLPTGLPGNSRPLWRWSVTDGLNRLNFGPRLAGPQQYAEPEALLEHIKHSTEASVFLLCDFHPYLEDSPKNVRLLKDIALNHQVIPHTLIFVSHAMDLPAELDRYSARFRLSLPNDGEIQSIVRDEAKRWSKSNKGARVRSDQESFERLVVNLKGLPHSDVRRLARSAIADDGAITESDIPAVNKAKFALMDMESVLSFEYQTEQFSQVGGLENLKRWLEQRRQVFIEQAENQSKHLDAPKGMLLLGVQGGGKSLAAKAVAGMWGVPLLRLDMAALYNKFVGETERNLRDALQLAEVMSPCVLWLDELEKGMGPDSSDNGVSQRMLGTLLTWMAEKKQSVFIVATSNDISRLPPELVRKGRFDEIFFVDLPNKDARKTIFEIHLSKRDLNPDNFALEGLVSHSAGFSGAEIEQAIVSSLYTAAAQERELATGHLLNELNSTRPLSVTMAEKIARLRQWASDRAVPA